MDRPELASLGGAEPELCALDDVIASCRGARARARVARSF